MAGPVHGTPAVIRSVMLPVASRTAHAAERQHTERKGGGQGWGQNDRIRSAAPWISTLTNTDGNSQIGKTSYQDRQQGPFRDGGLGVLRQKKYKENCIWETRGTVTGWIQNLPSGHQRCWLQPGCQLRRERIWKRRRRTTRRRGNRAWSSQ